MGRGTGGYDEARQAIERGMAEQRGLESGAEAGFNPYAGAGTEALDAYRRALAQGADPTALYNQLMGGYRESPEYKAQLEAGEQAASRAAAASGMLGSGAEMQHAAERAQALRSQDVQNYLNRVLGLRSQYLGGESGLAGMGFRSAEDIMRARMGLGQQIGAGYGGIGRTYIGEAQQPSWYEQLGGLLAQGAGTALGAYMGRPPGMGGAGMGGGIPRPPMTMDFGY